MTRNEAIASINAKLASLDDDRLQVLAEIANSLSDAPVRQLSDREMSLLARSKTDFSEGRATSLEESKAYVAEQLARRVGRASAT